MQTNSSEQFYLSDLLLVEVQPGWTKERVTITGGNYKAGTVLAKVGLKFEQLVPSASDSSATAVAVLAEDVDASVSDQPGIVIRRGAVVDADRLIWPSVITDTQKATAFTNLEARGIVARVAL